MAERTVVEGSPGNLGTYFGVEEMICEKQCIHSAKCPMLARVKSENKWNIGGSHRRPKRDLTIVSDCAVVGDTIERAKKIFPSYTIEKAEIIKLKRAVSLEKAEEKPKNRRDGMLLIVLILHYTIKSPVAEAMLAANKTKPRE